MSLSLFHPHAFLLRTKCMFGGLFTSLLAMADNGDISESFDKQDSTRMPRCASRLEVMSIKEQGFSSTLSGESLQMLCWGF